MHLLIRKFWSSDVGLSILLAVILEGLVGQLFPAIPLARLVSLEIESRQIRNRDEGGE